MFQQGIRRMHLDNPMTQDLLAVGNVKVDFAMRINPLVLSDGYLCGDRFRVVVPGYAMMGGNWGGGLG
jgi:hypothetical protein